MFNWYCFVEKWRENILSYKELKGNSSLNVIKQHLRSGHIQAAAGCYGVSKIRENNPGRPEKILLACYIETRTGLSP